MCEHTARTTGRQTLRNFSCMVTTSCMSVAVSNIGDEWIVGGKVICKFLMACYRCFFINVPNHNRFVIKVEGFTFRVSGLGFRFRDLGSWFQVKGFRFRLIDWEQNRLQKVFTRGVYVCAGSWHSKIDKNSTDLYSGVSYYSLELCLEGLSPTKLPWGNGSGWGFRLAFYF